MSIQTLRMSVMVLSLALTARVARADVCVTIDETRDTLSAQDRVAALLLLTRQFELAGERVVPGGCPAPYVVSHVQLGDTITVTLSGPKGQRDATALGLADVPAVYSQMVRSLLTGRPMHAAGIVDRANVSAAQAATPQRLGSDSLFYVRLGYGGIFGDRTYAGPSVGFIGYRKELDSFAIDVSFFNLQYNPSEPAQYGSSSGGFNGTWLKLEALHFRAPLSDRSLYVGGGLGWSSTSVSSDSKSWNGSGLQGELTAGYEIGRASTIRVFVQGDVSLPFYRLTAETYTFNAGSYTPSSWAPYMYTVATEHRYAPTLKMSIGFGWQRGRH